MDELSPKPAKSSEAQRQSAKHLGNSNKFDEAIVSFTWNYSDQNEQDYQEIIKAVGTGKIEVLSRKMAHAQRYWRSQDACKVNVTEAQ